MSCSKPCDSVGENVTATNHGVLGSNLETEIERLIVRLQEVAGPRSQPATRELCAHAARATPRISKVKPRANDGGGPNGIRTRVSVTTTFSPAVSDGSCPHAPSERDVTKTRRAKFLETFLSRPLLQIRGQQRLNTSGRLRLKSSSILAIAPWNEAQRDSQACTHNGGWWRAELGLCEVQRREEVRPTEAAVLLSRTPGTSASRRAGRVHRAKWSLPRRRYCS